MVPANLFREPFLLIFGERLNLRVVMVVNFVCRLKEIGFDIDDGEVVRRGGGIADHLVLDRDVMF